MPDLAEDKNALDWVVKNRKDPRAPMVLKTLGVDETFADAWKWTQDNPDDKRAPEVRNKVFLKIAETRPAIQEQVVSNVDRLVIKNLIDREPEVQQKYLERKGFNVRFKDGQLQARKPGETAFKVIDPKGIDLFDATDILSDIVEGLASGVASGAKVLGALSAPTTGPGGLLVGSALGGAATAGVEAAKQGLGLAIGAREDISGTEIAKAGALGAALPLGLGALGGVVKRGGGALARAIGFKGVTARAGTEAVEEAAGTLGVKSLPAQRFEGVAKQQSLVEQSTGLAGRGIRKQIEENKKQLGEIADSIVKDASARAPSEVAEQVEKQVISDVAEKLAPAEALYRKWETPFKFIKPKTEGVRDVLEELKKEVKFRPSAKRIVDDAEAQLDEVGSLAELKDWATGVGDEIRGKLPTAKLGNVSKLTAAANDARDETLLAQAKLQGDDIFIEASEDIAQASKIWRETIGEVEESLLARGKKVKLGPKKETAKIFEGGTELSRVNKLFQTASPKRLERLKTNFPEAFEELKQLKISEIAQRAEVAGQVDPKKLAKIIDKLDPKTARLMFDDDAITKSKALKTFLDSVTSTREIVGPSGTPAGFELFNRLPIPGINLITREINSLSRSATLKFMTDSVARQDFISRVGRLIQSELVKTGAFVGTAPILNEG